MKNALSSRQLINIFIFPITFRIHSCIYFRALMATKLQYLIAGLHSYQLEQEILDFSQGLRAIGVAADEKLALFADNSCRWLVSDQGKLLLCFVMTPCIVIPNVDIPLYCYFPDDNYVVPYPF